MAKRTDRLSDTDTGETEASDAAAQDPPSLGVFRALLAHDDPSAEVRLIPRQAAVLAIYAVGLPDLCADAMTPAEVRDWAARFAKQNPVAWHASMMGDVMRFSLVTGGSAAEAVPRYQIESTELIARAHAA